MQCSIHNKNTSFPLYLILTRLHGSETGLEQIIALQKINLIESGEHQISHTTILDKLVSHCLCTMYTVGSGQHCHVCSGEDSLCSNSSDGGTVTDCGDGVSTCLLGKSSKFLSESLSTVN